MATDTPLYVGNKDIPYFDVKATYKIPEVQPGEAGAAELVTDPEILKQLEGKPTKGSGAELVTDPETIRLLETTDIQAPSLPPSNKPSLSLGDKFKQMMTPPPDERPLWEKIARLPEAVAQTAAGATTGIFANTIGTTAEFVHPWFGGSREEAQKIGEDIRQQYTYQPDNPTAQYAMQVMGAPPGAIQQGAENIHPLLGDVIKAVFAVAPGMGGVKSAMAERPLGKTAPYTQQGLKAQQLAQEYGLPAYPSTLSTKPALQGIVNRFNSAVAPMFEKIKDTITSKVAEHNDAIKANLDDITSKFRTMDEQGNFLGEKAGIYQGVYDLLPEKFQLPKLREWVGEQLAELRDAQQKRPLNLGERNLKDYYTELYNKKFYTWEDVNKVNGLNPMSKTGKAIAKSKQYLDLKDVENGEQVINELKKTNTEYGYTTKSGKVTEFLNKVAGDDGTIDLAKWNRNYDNFKRRNIAGLGKDIMAKFDEINKVINERDRFKTEMETVFGKELKAYEDYQNKPTLGGIEKVLDKVAEWSIAGGAGGAAFGFPKVGVGAAALGGTALGLQQVGKGIAKRAVSPKGMMSKGAEGFKAPYEDFGMEREPGMGAEMEFGKKQKAAAAALAVAYEMLNDDDKDKLLPVMIGLYGGAKAKGYKEAKGRFSNMADKMERFEISDVGMKIKNLVPDINYPEIMSTPNKSTLGDMLHHSELFNQYPELKNIPTHIAIVPWEKALGSYTPKSGLNVTATNLAQAGRLLAHEIQHAIQEKEGFARGTSTIDPSYRNNAGEIEARDAAARMNLTGQQRARTGPYTSEDIPLSEWITRGHEGKPSLLLNERGSFSTKQIQKQIVLQKEPVTPRLDLEVRDKFGTDLSADGKAFMRFVDQNRNKTTIHPNAKTGLSIDFSTSCPARDGPNGACTYCYVEHPRTQKMLGQGIPMSPKSIVDNQYRNELLKMSPDLVKEVNKDGGIRMFSFGDYRPEVDFHNVEGVLSDASRKGIGVKAITKVKQFVDDWADHPNLTVNISTDLVPRTMSNAPTIEEALQWKADRPNVKIRSVALNEQQAASLASDPRVDVVTLYHGPVGDKLFQIVKAQNPKLVARVGEEAIKKELATWQNMPPNSKIAKNLQQEAKGKICCTGGKCSKDPTKCGLGCGSLITGVVVSTWLGMEDQWDAAWVQ
jgi:hypothetical protein